MDYFHVEDTSSLSALTANQGNAPFAMMQDMTNMPPRPSKRPQAHMGGARTTSPPRDATPTNASQQHVFSAAAPAWHPPAMDGGALPMFSQQQQQNGRPQSPESYGKMAQLMSQMESLMAQWVQLFPNGAPPAQEHQHAASMKRMLEQVNQLQRGSGSGSFDVNGGALPSSLEDPFGVPAGVPPPPRPARRPTASTAQSNEDAMFMMMANPMANQPRGGGAMQQQQQQFGNSGYRRGGNPGGYNSRSHHAMPPSNDNQTQIIALVEFKRQRMKKFECDLFISPGHYVIVEGDRGLDCGFVIHCCLRAPDGTTSRQESIDNAQFDISRIKSEPGRVVRLASKEEVDLLHGDIASEERVALKSCREIATRLGLNMEIVDCEFQFDRKKVSFYFEAPHSIDFRELNIELFRKFGVRIWLENLNSKVKNVVPEGAMSHADKMQYAKNGLRAPRRM